MSLTFEMRDLIKKKIKKTGIMWCNMLSDLIKLSLHKIEYKVFIIFCVLQFCTHFYIFFLIVYFFNCQASCFTWRRLPPKKKKKKYFVVFICYFDHVVGVSAWTGSASSSSLKRRNVFVVLLILKVPKCGELRFIFKHVVSDIVSSRKLIEVFKIKH